MGQLSLNRPRKIQMVSTAIETKLFFYFVTIFYDILKYTVPKTRRVLLDIWFDLMPLVTSYLVQSFRDGQSLFPPKCFEGYFKKKLSTTSVERWKSKLWCYQLIWITHLATIERPWSRKDDGHFEWKPFVCSSQGRFIKWRSSTTVNTWENEEKRK